MSKTKTRTLLIMRHAEKPDDASNPELAPLGIMRAKALAAYVPQMFGTPDAIIAAADSKHSVRPRRTVEPLARQCSLKVQTPYADAQYAELAANLRHLGSLVVVCWHHGELPKLMGVLGASPRSYPDPWNPHVFDLILQTELLRNGTVAVTPVQEPF